MLIQFLTSFVNLFSLIAYSSSSGQVSLPYSITLCTHAEYNPPFALKPPLANKGTESLNLRHPPLVLVITLPSAPSLNTGYLILYFWKTLL